MGLIESVVPAMQQLVYANHTTTTFLRGGIRIYMYMYIMYVLALSFSIEHYGFSKEVSGLPDTSLVLDCSVG